MDAPHHRSAPPVGVLFNVQISCPEGTAPTIAPMYEALLGMRRIDIGYVKLINGDERLPEIGFETTEEDRRPRWPDPEHPQQMHLDIAVGDLDAAEATAVGAGATRLRDDGDHRILADPFAHPFCLYADPTPDADRDPGTGRLFRIVFDCFSPRVLAAFYGELLGMDVRLVDTPERVEIAADDPDLPSLAFQHAVFPAARWPDPAHPEQLHLDLGFADPDAARDRLDALGAIRLHDADMHAVYADPAAHPFCVGGFGRGGLAQVEEYERWLADHADATGS